MKNKYWKAVDRRVNHLVNTQHWPRRRALENTRALFKTSKQWRRHYEKLT